jgi:hypothetical protein
MKKVLVGFAIGGAIVMFIGTCVLSDFIIGPGFWSPGGEGQGIPSARIPERCLLSLFGALIGGFLGAALGYVLKSTGRLDD